MNKYGMKGSAIRAQAKELVLEFMRNDARCSENGEGVRTAPLFRHCGFDWHDQPSAKSSQQQFWLVALLRELEAERAIERPSVSGPWRLTRSP